MSMAYVPEPGDAWGPRGRTTPAMRRTALALALLVLFWASQRVANPWTGWIRAGVVSALATGPTTTSAVLRMVRPVATFVAARSWGAVLDWWLRTEPTPRTAGRVVDTYGWHRRGGGFDFVPGDVIRFPAGAPVRAASTGEVETVRSSPGVVVVRMPSGARLVYAHVQAVQVRVGERVVRGTPIATAGPTPVLVEVRIRGFPANPAPYVAQVLR